MFVLVGITCAQVYIPTGVSTQSGIVRNVPTTVYRIPANTVLTDGQRAFVAAPVPWQWWANPRSNDDNRNEREEALRRLFENDNEDRLKNWLRWANDRDSDSRKSNRDDDDKNAKNRKEETIRDLLRAREDNDKTFKDFTYNKDQLRTLTGTTRDYDTGTFNRYRDESDRYTLKTLKDLQELTRTTGRN